MDKIEKIRYMVSYFDIEQMKPGARTIYDLFPDGRIIIKKYEPASRKIISKNLYHTSSADFERLCSQIRACIECSNRLVRYIDDSDAELIIYYEFGRVERMPRGLGNEETTVGEILEKFILDNFNQL